MKCKKPHLAPSTAYKYYKCRCGRCRGWKKEAAARTNDKEKARIRSQEWRKKNVQRSRASVKNWTAANPSKVLSMQLKKYGISLEQYNDLLRKQNGRCAICNSRPAGMQHSKTRLCVDHEHSTGKVRGLLCGGCNIGLGHFKHNIGILKNAIKYLEENGDVL